MREDNMESEKKVIKLLGTELYYETCGEGIPLLVIHVLEGAFSYNIENLKSQV
jgi:hypothetical protein